MFRSKTIFNRVMQALSGAFFLALIIAGVLGTTRVSAASSTTHAAELALSSGSNSCTTGMQSIDYYLIRKGVGRSKS